MQEFLSMEDDQCVRGMNENAGTFFCKRSPQTNLLNTLHVQSFIDLVIHTVHVLYSL